jgi:SAM-dependent methyltransferase
MKLSLYHQYYDRIYFNKDYISQVDTVLDIFAHIKKGRPKRILDVGCGTGNHAMLFANQGIKVTGIDTDCGSIEVAKNKIDQFAINQPKFFCGDIKNLKESGFDLVVSLFYVVTYIDRLDDLSGFFRAIHNHLKPDGLFVFDCWNGLAAILDPPVKTQRRITIDNENIEISINPTIDLINQSVLVRNEIKVKSPNEKNKKFNFSYKPMLWTPFLLREMLQSTGFEVVRMTTWARPARVATEKDWKILCICRKRKN